MGVNNASLLEEIRTTKKNLTLSSEAINKVHKSFTDHYNTFLALAEQLEGKFKELEVREVSVEKREGDVKAKEQQVKEREKKCIEREQKMETSNKKALANIEKWNEIEKRMQQNASKLPSMIQIDVGMC